MIRAAKMLSLVLVAYAVGPVFFPEPVHAGCIVLKNGEVLVGRIREEEVTAEQITMRWPYKTKTERGEIDIPRFRIRWYDREADEPTDAYWEEYGDTKIDSQWLVLYEKWKLRNKKDELGEGFEITPENFMSKASLSPIPVENGNFKIQKPEGWTSSIDKNGITIFLSDKDGTEGFRARIHVFAVKSAIGQKEDIVQWIEEEVAKLARGAGTFEVKERKRMRLKGTTGADQEMLTLTTRFDRPVTTLRKIMFRKKKTYFFAAYSHERDYSGLEFLFKACMRSMEIKEDTRSAKKPKAPSAPTPPAKPATGG